jgi:hypothetical protein
MKRIERIRSRVRLRVIERRAFSAALIVLNLISLSSAARGQAGTAEIAGSVKDMTGADLPNVKLTLIDQRNLRSREWITGSSGTYVVPALPAGEYSIKAELANFKTQIREGIVLQIGRQERVDFVLEVGDRTEVVTVQESLPLLRATNAEVSEVIGHERIVNLPLNGRQFVDLTLLSDNVFKAPRGTRTMTIRESYGSITT